MALACSHFDFQKRNPQNGKLERMTWSSLMKFTGHDEQSTDWVYHIEYRRGTDVENKRGSRKHDTKKWNGIGKKESQIKGRQVIFSDLDRITPARNFSPKIFTLAKQGAVANVSTTKVKQIEEYVSYVLEEKFTLGKIAAHLDKDIFKYEGVNKYSSFNAATGEEVLVKIIIDCVEAKKNSLILIDEIEVGLHPKIQRRLIDIIYKIACDEAKQFIITTHSPTILSTVPDKARIFLERKNDGTFKAISDVSVNAALSKMDSESYPLVDLYCEDDLSKKIIGKAIESIQQQYELKNFGDLINVIVSGAANLAFGNFTSHRDTYPYKKIKTGFACVLDGDKRDEKLKTGINAFPEQDRLYFLYSNESPESFLLRSYLKTSPNRELQFHLDSGNNHSFFQKMVEISVTTNTGEAFNLCWSCFINSTEGSDFFEELKIFLLSTVKHFSPDL